MIETIKAAYQRDQEEKPLATKAGDIPVSYDAITAQWLTAVLCKAHPQAEVTSFKLGEVDSGTWNRRRIFLQYNDVGRAAGLPRSVFCKAAHDLANRILLSAGATHGEVTFYNKLRPLLDINAPEALLANYDSVAFTSIVMLKDLADLAEFCSHHTPMNLVRAKSQMALLATLHASVYVSPEIERRLSDLVTWHHKFNNLVANHELRECCERGFIAAEALIPKRLFARQDEIWPATLRSVERHLTLPAGLMHGDVHLKNWYVMEGDRMGLTDWQVICRGHWSRDLAYTISTALKTEDRRRWERELIEYYLYCLHAAGGPSVAFAEAWTNYRQQLMTVLTWWTVTLAPSPSMPDMQPLDTTLEFMTRIAHAIDDLDSLAV
jgi:thiamine kinase-like enzyme